MRKPHFEEVLTMFPAIKMVRFQEGFREHAGILSQLQAVKDHLKASGRKLLSQDKTIYAHEDAAKVWAVFQANGAKIFKMAREFSEQLVKVDLDVPVASIPIAESMICIEFPEHMRFDLGGGRYARSVYVFVTDERGIAVNFSGDQILSKHYMEMTFPLYDENDVNTWEVHTFGLPIERLDMTFQQALAACKARETKLLGMTPMKTYNFNEQLFSFVLKCYLYIHSGDPDLREHRAPRPPQTAKVKKQRLWFRAHENESLLDMTLVGFNFKKPTVYTVGSSQVTGHFRWQPYGPKREKVKLIWIDPFVRSYKNVSSETGGEQPSG